MLLFWFGLFDFFNQDGWVLSMYLSWEEVEMKKKEEERKKKKKVKKEEEKKKYFLNTEKGIRNLLRH